MSDAWRTGHPRNASLSTPFSASCSRASLQVGARSSHPTRVVQASLLCGPTRSGPSDWTTPHAPFGELVAGLFGGGSALQPSQRGDAGEEHVELEVRGKLGLAEDAGLRRIDAARDAVGGDFADIGGAGASLGAPAGEGMPLGDH